MSCIIVIVVVDSNKVVKVDSNNAPEASAMFQRVFKTNHNNNPIQYDISVHHITSQSGLYLHFYLLSTK